MLKWEILVFLCFRYNKATAHRVLNTIGTANIQYKFYNKYIEIIIKIILPAFLSRVA